MFFKQGVFSTLFVLLSVIIQAQPINDNCNSATLLNAESSCLYTQSTNSGATDSGINHSCASYQGADVWFKIPAPNEGELIIETNGNGGITDTGIQAYSSCGGISIGCDDDGGPGVYSKLVIDNLSAYDTIYVAVWAYSASSSGSFSICAYNLLPQNNDDCSDALNIPVNSQCNNLNYTTENATDSGINHSCENYFDKDVWFKLEIPSSGNVVIQCEGQFGSSFALEAYNSCQGVSLGCDLYQDLLYGGVLGIYNQTPGDTIYLAVWRTDSGSFGAPFTICAYEPPPAPINDFCGDALYIEPNPYDFCASHIYTTRNASGFETYCGGIQNSNVWFKTIIPESGELYIKTDYANGLAGTDVTIFSNCSSQPIMCDSGSFNEFSYIELTNQTPGDTIYILVDGYKNPDNPSDEFKICISSLSYDEPCKVTGSTMGNFSISDIGSANYSIQFQFSPGTSGMTPQLGINYNSNGSNGAIGLGWSLSGLQAVTRMAKTIDPDGYNRAIQLDSTDIYAMNGERLVTLEDFDYTGSHGVYGENNTEYRLEANNMTKVISKGDNQGCPEYFIAYTKSGLIIELGKTPDSRIEAQGSTQTLYWNVNKIIDRYGNYIEYEYFENNHNGEYFLTKIKYTGNLNEGISPYAFVELKYEERPDSIPIYLTGSQIKSTKRLSEVNNYFNQTLVKSYKLIYDESELFGQSRLIRFQEYGSDGSCFSPLKFKYAEQVDTLFQDEWGDNNVEFNTPLDINQHALYDGDFNYDGITDMWAVRPSTGSNYLFIADQIGRIITNQTPPNLLPNAQINGRELLVVDLNSDGFDDILSIDWVSGANNTFLNNQDLTFTNISNLISTSDLKYHISGSDTARTKIDLIDYNGDGLLDISIFQPLNNSIFFYKNKTNIQGANTLEIDNSGIIQDGGFNPQDLYSEDEINPSHTSEMRYTDLNGDNLPDLLFWITEADTMLSNFRQNEFYFYENNSTESTRLFSFVCGGHNCLIDTSLLSKNFDKIRISNFNGDSYADLAFISNDFLTVETFINKGDLSFLNQTNSNIGITSTGYSIKQLEFIDFNADGNADVFLRAKSDSNDRGKYEIKLNDGNLSFTVPLGDSYEYSITDDFFIDSLGQFFFSQYGENYFWGEAVGTSLMALERGFPAFQDGLWERLEFPNHGFNPIIEIENGIGHNTQITYRTILNSNTYSKGSSLTYPDFNYIGNMPVVSYYETGGVGFEHYYQNAKMDLCGRGFRGFELVHIRNVENGIQTCNHYWQDYRHTTAPKKSSTTSYNGCFVYNLACEDLYSKISRSSNYLNSDCSDISYDYNNIDPSEPPPTRKYYFASTESVNKESFNTDFSPVDTLYERYKYNNLTGDLIYSVMDYGNNLKDSTYFEYSNDYSTWKIGRITSSTLYKFAPNKNPYSKRVNFSYDLLTGSLIEERINPDLPIEDQIIKTYTYDGFGNIVSSKTRYYNGNKFVERVSTTTMDSLGRFTTSSINDLGHTELYENDSLTGLILSQQNFNGLITKYEYDGFNRLSKLEYPDAKRINSTIHSIKENEHNYPLNYGTTTSQAYYYTMDSSNYENPITSYFDQFNREVLSETINYYGDTIASLSEFQDYGLLKFVSDPINKGGESLKTNITFDKMGRELSRDFGSGIIETKSYSGYEFTSINLDGQSQKVLNDPKGRMNISTNNNASAWVKYDYDAAGNLISMEDPNGNLISMTYDIHNNRTSLNDPDFGIYNYEFNPLGELISVISPKGDSTFYFYDTLGRTIRRIEKEGSTEWQYDTKPYGIGLISKIKSFKDSTEFWYDTLSRVEKIRHSFDSLHFEFLYTYDEFSRQKTLEYPNGFKIKYEYDSNGYMFRVKNFSSDELIWQLDSLDNRGRITQYTLGNGVVTRMEYDLRFDHLLRIKSNNLDSTFQDLIYNYSNEGNLLSRVDSLRSVYETFDYDWANRLTTVILNGVDTLSMSYDLLGNITYKSDVGTYNYGENGAGPKTLTSIDLIDNRICVPSAFAEYEYTSFNKVKSILNDTASLEVCYGYGHERLFQKKFIGNSLIETKYFIGNFEVINSDTIDYEISYITIPGIGTVSTNISTSNNTQQNQYWHKDHLSSLYCVTNENGNIINEYSFDVWGLPRELDGSSLGTKIYSISSRGFTGHEHLSLFSLINMNGRIYDPVIGRFISPDPMIQNPSNLQNLNRYAYVLNNPLRYSDPSGLFFKKVVRKITRGVKKVTKRISSGFKNIANGRISDGLKDWFKAYMRIRYWQYKETDRRGKKVFGEETWNTIVVTATTITVAYFTGGLGTGFAATIASGAISGFAGNAVGTLSATDGNVDAALEAGGKGAIVGGISAGLTYGVGDLAGAAGGNLSSTGDHLAYYGVKVAGHGTVQGVMAEAQGGKFEHGFASGAVSSFAGGSTGSMAGDVIFGAALGGTASELGGGKFSNGAISGSMNVLYNFYQHLNTVKAAKQLYQYVKDDINSLYLNVSEYASYVNASWETFGPRSNLYGAFNTSNSIGTYNQDGAIAGFVGGSSAGLAAGASFGGPVGAVIGGLSGMAIEKAVNMYQVRSIDNELRSKGYKIRYHHTDN